MLHPPQAVGPVAVTSLLLGSGLPALSDFTQPSQVTNSDGECASALGKLCSLRTFIHLLLN